MEENSGIRKNNSDGHHGAKPAGAKKEGEGKGDKSKMENSTDHFCEDTRQNALAGCPYKSRSRDLVFTAWTPHHFTIQLVREITSLDSKLPDHTEL